MFAEIRAQARRTIHAKFQVPATYEDDVVPATAVAVRWHNRFVKAVGDTAGGDFAEIIENIDRIIFNSEELAAKSIAPKRDGIVRLQPMPDLVLLLDVREPVDGPINVIWTVIRPRAANAAVP